MKIKYQILLYVLGVTIIVFVASFGYIYYRSSEFLIDNSKELIKKISLDHANLIKSEINLELGKCRALANSFASIESDPNAVEFESHKEALVNLFTENPGYLSAWVSWEYNYINPGYEKSHGKVEIIIHEFSGRTIIEHDTVNLESEDIQSPYYESKITASELVTPPFYYTYDSRIDEELITRICVPIIREGNFIGLAGVDLKISSIQKYAEQKVQFKNSYSYLMTNNGSIISHPDETKIGQRISEIDPKYDEKFEVSSKIKTGLNFDTFGTFQDDETDFYIAYSPIPVGQTNNPWSVAVAVPYISISSYIQSGFKIAFVIAIVGLILLSLITYSISFNLSNSLIKTVSILKNLARGNIEESSKFDIKESQNEIAQIKGSVNKLIDGFNKFISFAKEIGKGNLNITYQKLSEDDVLGSSLLDMQQNLLKARKEQTSRQVEDEKRNWITQGLNQLGDVLRKSRKNLEEFSDNIVKSFTDYVSANQCALFIINNDNPADVYIELKSAYAYDRHRLMQKRINFGIGLVGRSIQEKETIHLHEIPEDYIFIGSGLGEALPKNLLIVPLVFDEVVYGAIEIASFKLFEPHEVEFVEKFGESIGAAISNIKSNERTSKLLEESKTKSEELSSREGELRLHMQELQVAQEESMKKEIEINGIINALTSTSSIVHFDFDGTILKLNESSLLSSRFYTKEMIGKNHREFAVESVEDPKEYNEFWDDLRNGNSRTRLLYVKDEIEERWIFETYTPIFDANKKVYKVICIQNNITESKVKEIELQNRINDLEKKLKGHKNNGRTNERKNDTDDNKTQ